MTSGGRENPGSGLRADKGGDFRPIRRAALRKRAFPNLFKHVRPRVGSARFRSHARELRISCGKHAWRQGYGPAVNSVSGLKAARDAVGLAGTADPTAEPGRARRRNGTEIPSFEAARLELYYMRAVVAFGGLRKGILAPYGAQICPKYGNSSKIGASATNCAGPCSS